VFPLTEPVAGYILFSGELRPRSGVPGVYEADYATDTDFYGWAEYGSVTATLPTTDSDANGLPDIAQFDKAVNISFSGSVRSDWPSIASDTFTGTLVRGANQLAGSYTVRFTSDGSTSSGSVEVQNTSGTVSYERGSQNTMTLYLTQTDPLGATRTLTGTTTFTVNSVNQIAFPQFSVTSSDGQTYTIMPGSTLNRTGHHYHGNASLVDGIVETSWRDAINWVIEIWDDNDFDSNGIPDLSDALPVAPTIAVQPASRIANAGSTVTFSVTATGTAPLRYQWHFDAVDLTNATNASLVLTNIQSANEGIYSVTVANSLGVVTSSDATLSVVLPPRIITQPQSQTALAGTNVTFFVDLGGTAPLSYRWRFNGTNIVGATNASFTRTNVQSANAGAYSVVVTNRAGSVTSSNATLAVLVPPTITLQPRSLSVTRGAAVSLTVTATGTAPLRYQWVYNGDAILKATNSSLSITNVQETNAGTYSVIITNVAGQVVSSNALLTVNVPPTIAAQPQNTTAIVGSNVTLSVVATGTTPLRYQWRKDGLNVPGATNSILNFAMVQTNNAGNYRVVISNVVGSVTSLVAVLTVNVTVTITSQPKSASVRSGVNVTFSVAATGTMPRRYQWQRNGVPISAATNASYTITNVQSAHAGQFQVTVSNVVGPVSSVPAILYVNAPLQLLNVQKTVTGSLQMELIGRPQTNYVLQASSNLVTWISLVTNSSTNGIITFTDSNFITHPKRFYRGRVR